MLSKDRDWSPIFVAGPNRDLGFKTLAVGPLQRIFRGANVLYVKDIMSEKAVTIEPSASVQKAVERLLDENVSSLMVVDEHHRMIGLINESALLAATLDGQIRHHPVSLHMDRKFISVRPSDTLETAIDASILHRVRHIPVLDGSRLVGLITRRDLLRAAFGREHLATRYTA
jgi:CBS domain-containing protein